MAEETEVKSTEEVKPQEPKSQAKSVEKKAPAKGGKKKRPFNAKRGAAPAAKKPAVFSDSLEDRFPALAAKLKKQIEDGIKQKIKDAQNDPKVKAASKKFAAEK
ncbi:MAG: hypothetical protein MJY82_03200 [Fibrobacter sp.]|nr:hypothetical protein [Fibrobacter sp.]